MDSRSTPRPEASRATRLLHRIAEGERQLEAELLEVVYRDLRELAGAHMRAERPDHTLQATALVHEAWLRVDPAGREPAACRSQFLAAASRAMRSVLIDHARKRNAVKRGGGVTMLLRDADEVERWDADLQQVLDVEEALVRLAARDAELARIVEMRFFGGLGAQEIADALGKTRRQIEGSWAFARGWLGRELERGRAR